MNELADTRKIPVEYRGFTAEVRYSAEDQCFIGRVLGISDIVSIEGDTVEALTTDFHNAIDFYISSCKECGKTPGR